MKSKLVALIILSIFIICCNPPKESTATIEQQSLSTIEIEDKKAAQLVSKMMEAMGGAQEWEELQYVSWTFFGARHLVWDKKNNRVRIESPRDSSIYLVDLQNSSEVRFSAAGNEVFDTSALTKKFKEGRDIWINDMYWLFMPFKLYDPGVTVSYVHTDTTLVGALSDVLELSFDNVGNTPENKYQIYIDQKDHLIKQWNFYADFNQEEASRIWPWDNYSDFDGLLLSSDRSDKGGPSNVRVYDHLDDKVFTSFEAFEFY